MKRRSLTLAVAALTAAAGLIMPASHASAASDCWRMGDGLFACSHVANAAVWQHRSYGSHVVGYMDDPDPAAFWCWGYGDWHSGGNNVWYWTPATNGRWGNVPAVDVYTHTDPFPGSKQC